MTTNDIDVLLKPVERYMHKESTAGIVLLISTVVAVFWANSGWSESYHHLWDLPLSLRLGAYEVSNTLHHWINDGLMAMFFFVVGLELKREMMAGELSNIKNAMLPLVAAAGGMVGPALLYISLNPTGIENNGWGIPTATDIAFALGIVSLLGSRVPVSLKIFLTALAIADDLGAVLIIAFFYTSDISMSTLGIGALFIVMLLAANYFGVRSTLFYGIVGIGGVWLAFLMSGVHATIAGVLAAFAIPARTKIDENKFIASLEQKLDQFHTVPPNDVTLLEPAQYQIIHKIQQLTKAAGTPLQRLEHQLHPWVSFLIMPVFALANAGLLIDVEVLSHIFSSKISLGVLSGLVVGKFVGVVLFSWILIKLRLAALPAGTTWTQLMGIGLLAGVGFTMSLFITTLAFDDPSLIAEAKIGIFAASVVSGILGYAVLRMASRHSNTLGTRK